METDLQFKSGRSAWMKYLNVCSGASANEIKTIYSTDPRGTQTRGTPEREARKHLSAFI